MLCYIILVSICFVVLYGLISIVTFYSFMLGVFLCCWFLVLSDPVVLVLSLLQWCILFSIFGMLYMFVGIY